MRSLTSLEPFVSRKEMGWPKTPAPVTNTNLGMIAHYDSGKRLTNLRKAAGSTPHNGCKTYWNETRHMHMQGNGWLDVGYAYFACPDGVIFEGRGDDHQQAAEAPTPGKLQNGNSRYISCTFGLGVGEKPTAKALEAWRRLRAWYRADRGGKAAIYGHRDFTATSCPGDVIYAMVKDGTLAKVTTPEPPAPKPPTPEPQDQGEFMQYAAYGRDASKQPDVPPNEWRDVWFDVEYADPDNIHSADAASILAGAPTIYVLEFNGNVAAPVGTKVKVRATEFQYDSSVTPPVDKQVEPGKESLHTVDAEGLIFHTCVGYLQKGRKLRVQLWHNAASPVKITDASLHVAASDQ